MDALQFAYWLQGFSELNGAPPTPEQWQTIREHLGTVFKKVTPPLAGAAAYYMPNGGCGAAGPAKPIQPGAIC